MADLLLQIIQRAKTFQIFKWHYRSPELYNPYVLASQGYQCVALNTLQCHICHNKVIFTNEDGLQRPHEDVSKELSNHENTCQYHGQSGKSFTKPELYLRMDQLILKTKQSYKKNQNQKLFPLLNYKKFIAQLQENNQIEIFKTIMSKYRIDQKQVRISFILTVMGWTKKSLQEIQCAFCGRCLNIKQYKITTEDKQKVEVGNQNQADYLDLSDEHRYFCLWVHGMKGWEIYIQHMYDTLGEAEELFRNVDPEELKIKKIRVLLHGYLENFKNITNNSFEKVFKIMEECSQMVQSIEQTQEAKDANKEQLFKRKREMDQFLKDIQTQIRLPLKKIKID